MRGLLPIALALLLGLSACGNGEVSEEPETATSCGGTACGADQWCDVAADGACSAPEGGAASCQPRPEACTLQYQPVCGCDGKTYGNACQAHAEGVTVLHEGEC